MLFDVLPKKLRASFHDLYKNNYPHAIAMLVYGSQITEKTNPLSDVDLIIVVAPPAISYREKLEINGLVFDIFVYDFEALNGAMYISRISGTLILASSVASSVVISNNESISSGLRRTANVVLKSGPLSRNFDDERQHLTNLLDDLIYCNDQGERTYILVEIFRAISDILCKSFNNGGVTGKIAARVIYKEKPILFNQLVKSFRDAISGDHVMIRSFSSAILHQYGGLLRQGFKTRLPEVIRIPLIEDENYL